MGGQHFEHHGALADRVDGFPDFTHSATPQYLLDDKLADRAAG